MRTRKPHAYVLDTTVLIEMPDVMYRLAGQIFIPTAVIKEIDGLKRGDSATAKAAREVARTLDRLGNYEDYSAESLADGVRLSTGGILIVYPFSDPIDDLSSDADNRIVGAALRLKREGVQGILLLTTDHNMRTIARAHRVKADFYPFEMPDFSQSLEQPPTAPYFQGTAKGRHSQVANAATVTSPSRSDGRRGGRQHRGGNVFVLVLQWVLNWIRIG